MKCPYCRTDIPDGSLRCRACAGELRHCPKCRTLVGVVARSKFVGLVRGGTKTQLRCLRCGAVLDGPRW